MPHHREPRTCSHGAVVGGFPKKNTDDHIIYKGFASLSSPQVRGVWMSISTVVCQSLPTKKKEYKEYVNKSVNEWMTGHHLMNGNAELSVQAVLVKKSLTNLFGKHPNLKKTSEKLSKVENNETLQLLTAESFYLTGLAYPTEKEKQATVSETAKSTTPEFSSEKNQAAFSEAVKNYAEKNKGEIKENDVAGFVKRAFRTWGLLDEKGGEIHIDNFVIKNEGSTIKAYKLPTVGQEKTAKIPNSNGYFDKAEQLCKKIISSSADKNSMNIKLAKTILGKIFLAQGREIEIVKKSLREAGTAPALFTLASIERKAGNYGECVDVLREIHANELPAKEHAILRNNIAWALMAICRIEFNRSQTISHPEYLIEAINTSRRQQIGSMEPMPVSGQYPP